MKKVERNVVVLSLFEFQEINEKFLNTFNIHLLDLVYWIDPYFTISVNKLQIFLEKNYGKKVDEDLFNFIKSCFGSYFYDLIKEMSSNFCIFEENFNTIQRLNLIEDIMILLLKSLNFDLENNSVSGICNEVIDQECFLECIDSGVCEIKKEILDAAMKLVELRSAKERR